MAVTELTKLMINRDKLMIRKQRVPWHKFKIKRELENRIGLYKRMIDVEMENLQKEELEK